MYIKNSHRTLGLRFAWLTVAIASFVAPFGIIALNIQQAHAADALGTWATNSGQTCPISGGSSTLITSILQYTNSVNKTWNFSCLRIDKLRGGQALQMVLQGPSDGPCNTKQVIRIPGGDPATITDSYTNATSGEWDGQVQTGQSCSGAVALPFSLAKSYTDSNPTGTWTSQTPGTILFEGATYTQSSTGGNDMTLTLPVTDNPCTSSFQIVVKNYQTAKTGVETDTQHSTTGPPCVQSTITFALTNSFQNAPLSPPTTQTGACSIGTGIDWVLCPIMDLAEKAIQGLSAALTDFLYTPTQQIFNTDFQTTFNTFRNIGIALLVIAGLVMVLSQAAGLEIFAAYTVRKALPRIVIAAIGMALAWPILQFVIIFFNDIGVWTQDLILGSVKSISSGNYALSSYDGPAIIELVVGGSGALLFSAGIVFSFLGTVALALLLAFFVLAIRQMVILVAVLIAPLAIAASILPGTERLWKFWRESLLTALVMFPIIMAFLGAGEALSYIAGAAAKNTGGNGGQATTWNLVAAISLIAPLFLLPYAFRIAGGLMGTVHALATNGKLGKGLFGALSTYRGKQFGKRMNDAKTGNFWRQGSVPRWLGGSAVDKLAAIGSRGVQGAYLRTSEPLNRGRREALRSSIGFDTAMAAAEKDPSVKAILANDDYLQAIMSSGGTESGIRRQLKRINPNYSETDVGAIMNAVRTVGYSNMNKVAATYLPSTGTAFKAANEGGASMLQALNEAYGDDRIGFTRALAAASQGANQARRPDLAAGSFTEKLRWAERLRQNPDDFDNVRLEMDRRALETVAPGQLVGARASSIERLIPAMEERLNQAQRPGANPDELTEASAYFAALYDEMGRSAHENAAVLRNKLMSKAVQGGETLQQYIERSRNDPRFQEWRREYSSRMNPGQIIEANQPPPDDGQPH